MRVLAVADAVGGVRTFISELAPALEGCGVELDLALLGPPDAVAGLGPLPVRNLAGRDLALEWMADPWADVETAAEWVQELVADWRPDVLHMNTFTPVRCPDVPVVLTVHSCVLTWWRAVHGCDAPPEWDRYRALVTAALERAEIVVTPTRALLDALAAVYGWPRSARVIANGRRVAADTGAAERARLVVTVGRLWDRAKNVVLVADAAREIDAEVVAIGAGEAGGLRALGLLPPADVLRWLRRAALYVEPARYEPFGLAALEAALCGCALILGDIPSLREVWGDAARYVDPDDAGALAAVMRELLDDEPARFALAARAGARARRYSPSAMGRGYLDVYAAAAARTPGFATR